MRIGFDAKRLFHNATGLGNYSRSLVEMLVRFGVGDEWWLFNPKPPRITFEVTRPQVKEIRPRGGWKYFPSLWRSVGISGELKRLRPDVYHGLSGELPLGISRTRIPSILTVHDVIFMRFPRWYSPVDRRIYEAKLRYALRHARKVVAVSEQTRRDLLELTDVSPGKVEVIYQTCDAVFKQPLAPELLKEVRHKYRLPPKFLLYVGTLEPRKNALTLVKALRDLPYSAVLVGRMTAYGEKVREFVRQEGMEERIRFLHGISRRDLAALYRLAHVSVYPAIYEGFGIPLIESLYSETPVITNSRGVFPEVAGKGGIYLRDVASADEMREKIQFAMQTPKPKMLEGVREELRRFDEDVLARQWKTLYEKVSR